MSKKNTAAKKDAAKNKKKKKFRITKLDIWRLSFIFVSLLLTAGIYYLEIPHGLRDAQTIRETLTRLELELEHYYIYVGDTLEASVRVYPSTAIADLSYRCDDSAVVSVSGDMMEIKGAGAGTAEFRVVDVSGIETKALLTVVEKQLPPDSDLPPLYKDRLIAVNADYALTADDVPDDLVPIKGVPITYQGRKMRAEAFAAYKEFYAAAVAATGQSVNIISAYRDYAYQNMLFSNRVKALTAQGLPREAAEAKAALTTQPPGHSEHQLGDTVDVSVAGNTDFSFHRTPVGAWMTEHAHEYGFILRYPSDKEAITKISYEPWHFRYVGTGHAAYIYEHKICLEEYIELQERAAIVVDLYAQTVTAEQVATGNLPAAQTASASGNASGNASGEARAADMYRLSSIS